MVQVWVPMHSEPRSVSLDGLRTIAVAMVILYHSVDYSRFRPGIPEFDKFSPGGGGVRIFFVLSGFLITGILLRARAAAQTRAVSRFAVWRAFLVRRVLRIIPLAYVALAILWLVRWPAMREYGAWYFAYAGNFVLCPGCDEGVGHFWSLAVEEQFYLLWPFVILFVPRDRLRSVIVAVILAAGACRGALVATNHLYASYELLPARLDSLALGGLVALLVEDGCPARWLLSRLILAGGVCLLLGVRDSSARAAVFNEWGMIAFSASVVLWIATYPKSSISRLLSLRPLVYLGTISYGLYVWHGIVPDFVNLLRERLHVGFWIPMQPGPARLVFVATTSIILASVSWRFLEQPLNELKRYFPYVPTPAVRFHGATATLLQPASSATVRLHGLRRNS